MSNLTTVFQKSAVSVTSATVNQTDPLATGAFTHLEIDINVTALKAACTISFTWSRVDSFGNLYTVWTGGVSATGVIIADIGYGMSTPACPGSAGVLSWTPSGSSPTATFTVMVQGR